jgi:hypothetical protein
MSEEEALVALRTLAESSGDPALEAAPFDDEPYAEDDRAASDEGWAAFPQM